MLQCWFLWCTQNHWPLTNMLLCNLATWPQVSDKRKSFTFSAKRCVCTRVWCCHQIHYECPISSGTLSSEFKSRPKIGQSKAWWSSLGPNFTIIQPCEPWEYSDMSLSHDSTLKQDLHCAVWMVLDSEVIICSTVQPIFRLWFFFLGS